MSEAVNVYNLQGGIERTIELPPAFFYPVRTDLIRRAVRTFQMNRMQPYGHNPMSGMRHVGHNWGPNHGRARIPRRPDGARGTIIASTVGGRDPHAPTSAKVLSRKMNRKERRLARFAALSAVKDRNLVTARGHRLSVDLKLPIVLVDDVEKVTRTKEAIEVLKTFGLYDDVLRAMNGRKIRAGRGKTRGRRYKTPRSVLLVVKDGSVVSKSFGNLPGVDVVEVRNLNAEHLAPGGHPGRLTVFSEGAIGEIRRWTP